MGKVIIPNAVKRKVGYLYYVDGKGNVCEAKMSRGGKKKKQKKEKQPEKILEEEIKDEGDFDIDFD